MIALLLLAAIWWVFGPVVALIVAFLYACSK